ncbi:MAG: PorT family protein [Bacteroidia bacterium]|nr:PorT family protein [Bacteroidia bacterium]
MKTFVMKTLGLFLLLLVAQISWGQEEIKRERYEPAKDTVYVDDEIPDQDDDDDDYDRDRWDWRWDNDNWHMDLRLGTMFSLGVSTFLYDGSFELPAELDYLDLELGKSTHFKWDIVRHRLGRQSSQVSLEYGLAISYMNYAFTNSTRLKPGEPELTYVIDNVNYKKNKFKTTFLEVPLMVSILTDPERSSRGFNLAFGGYAGILLKAKQKFKGPNGKEKVKDDFNLNKFRYGLQGMIGVGRVNLYAQYSLVDLFKDNQGPELSPINIGIVLAGF